MWNKDYLYYLSFFFFVSTVFLALRSAVLLLRYNAKFELYLGVTPDQLMDNKLENRQKNNEANNSSNTFVTNCATQYDILILCV